LEINKRKTIIETITTELNHELLLPRYKQHKHAASPPTGGRNVHNAIGREGYQIGAVFAVSLSMASIFSIVTNYNLMSHPAGFVTISLF
jgi:hypothetical protein